MTNSWTDIKNADVILIMGGNAAEAHPCGFKWVTEAKANHGAKLIVVDPRFTRSAAVADLYCPLRAGTDIAFLSGVVNYLLNNNKIHADYVKSYTNATYLVKEAYNFDASTGLYSGYDAEKRVYNRDSWDYELNADGQPVVYGTRPEHLMLADVGGIPAHVVVLEPTGMDTFVACRHEGVELSAVFRERHDFAPGSTIRLQPDLQRAHLFDAGTGQLLAA